jgi:hypothetical protein
MPSPQNLFVSAKLNTFHTIMQNYVIFFCRDFNYIARQELQRKTNKKFQILHLKEFVRDK